MKFKAVWISKGLLALATLVGFFPRVGSDVLGEVVPTGEAGRAEGALVGFLPAVDQEVVLEVVRTDEPFSALLAAEWLDLRVPPLDVVLQVEGRSEGGVALRALVRLLTPVHENVALHVVDPLSLPAVLALDPDRLPVGQPVVVQPLLAGRHETAGLACEQFVLLVHPLVQVEPPLRLELSGALIAHELGRLVRLGVSRTLVLSQIYHSLETIATFDADMGLAMIVHRDVLVEAAFSIEDFMAVSTLKAGEEPNLSVGFLQGAQIFPRN